jgi:hypothetical protein
MMGDLVRDGYSVAAAAAYVRMTSIARFASLPREMLMIRAFRERRFV